MSFIKSIILLPLAFFLLQCGQKSRFEKPVVHIGVVVSDLYRSLDFYRNVLGMQEVGVISMDAELGKKSGLTGGLPAEVRVLKLEDEKCATEWKLMTFDSLFPAVAGQKYIQDATGMRYAGITVRSVAPFLENLRKYNVPLLGDTPVEISEGRYLVLFQDPDGIFIELIGDE